MKNIIKINFLQKDFVAETLQLGLARNVESKEPTGNLVACSKAIINRKVDECSKDLLAQLWCNQTEDMIIDTFIYDENAVEENLKIRQWCRVVLQQALMEDYNLLSNNEGTFETITVSYQGILFGMDKQNSN